MDRNTVIGFVLIGALLVTMMMINSKRQHEFQGNPETAIKNFLGALARKNQKDIKDAVIIGADSKGIGALSSLMADDALFNATVKYDTASLVLGSPAEKNGLTVVAVSEKKYPAVNFIVGLDEHQRYKVMLDQNLILGMMNHKPAELKQLAPLSDSVYHVWQQELSPKTEVATTAPADSSQAKPDSWFLTSGAKAETTILENDLLKITFNSKGASIGNVELKKFKKADGTPVFLNQSEFNKFSYAVNSGKNQSTYIENVLFKAQAPVKNADNSTTLNFVAGEDSVGKKITHSYTIHPGNYMIDFAINISGAEQVFTQKNLNLRWQVESPKIEQDHAYELTQSHYCYLSEDKFDFEYIAKPDAKDLVNTKWVGIKQQFFLSALIYSKNFNNTHSGWVTPTDTAAGYLTQVTTDATLQMPQGNSIVLPFQMYFGPSDYNVLKQYHNDMEYIVPYGSGIFSFVKYINRYFLLPVFDFLRSNIASMGIVILLLTLLIRLITSPILYKSYLSGAKMKVLKPEVDALKAKYKDDQQTFGMEQMKLWKSAGVSPLGGCLPALLQIPIFMSLYYFFQSNISLRGESFLWATNLAQYDSIAHLPFSIPFYGDHVSLFTLTAVITSLLISLYSMSNMQDNNNPLMKYMPYIFPFMLLGIFNKLPAALTWYYTISNTITLLLQVIIQKYIINHDKIIAEIAENRKKPMKKSKWQERIDAMQESQKKLQDLKNKSGGKA